MNRINYDERLHVRFHEGRAHDEAVMRLWRQTVRRVVGERIGLTILDLGSGTEQKRGQVEWHGHFINLLCWELHFPRSI